MISVNYNISCVILLFQALISALLTVMTFVLAALIWGIFIAMMHIYPSVDIYTVIHFFVHSFELFNSKEVQMIWRCFFKVCFSNDGGKFHSHLLLFLNPYILMSECHVPSSVIHVYLLFFCLHTFNPHIFIFSMTWSSHLVYSIPQICFSLEVEVQSSFCYLCYWSFDLLIYTTHTISVSVP